MRVHAVCCPGKQRRARPRRNRQRASTERRRRLLRASEPRHSKDRLREGRRRTLPCPQPSMQLKQTQARRHAFRTCVTSAMVYCGRREPLAIASPAAAPSPATGLRQAAARDARVRATGRPRTLKTSGLSVRIGPRALGDSASVGEPLKHADAGFDSLAPNALVVERHTHQAEDLGRKATGSSSLPERTAR